MARTAHVSGDPRARRVIAKATTRGFSPRRGRSASVYVDQRFHSAEQSHRQSSQAAGRSCSPFTGTGSFSKAVERRSPCHHDASARARRICGRGIALREIGGSIETFAASFAAGAGSGAGSSPACWPGMTGNRFGTIRGADSSRRTWRTGRVPTSPHRRCSLAFRLLARSCSALACRSAGSAQVGWQTAIFACLGGSAAGQLELE